MRGDAEGGHCPGDHATALRVLIADDHNLLRDALALFLHQAGGLAVATESSLPAALDRLRRDGPFDLVVLDLLMPGMNGFEGLEAALALNAGRPVAVISGAIRPGLPDEAAARGAAGFLPKTLSALELAEALRHMARGGRYHARIEAEDPAFALTSSLTPRERQVLEGFCNGRSNREIAQALVVSEPTVKLHAKTLCRKIGASNRTQAAMIARAAGLF